ncbi:hypothetical protein FRC08_005647 [Ceratobasidium sp. 394]|nr:hypothetical protein FRC08_005647 [Ceratobasidium sp. 394]KAG9092354.1 hypothetical protein FS749_015801 [Ceratobasidium sp. UAMH 11750]
MSASDKPFQWQLESLSVELTIGEKPEELEIPAFLIWNDKPNERYLRFPSLYQDFVIDLLDFAKRIHKDTFMEELKKDFDQGTITCPLWTVKGSQLTKTDVQKSRIFRSMLQARDMESLEDYRRRWIVCWNGAIDVASSQGAPKGKFDLLSRFYHPDNKSEFRLCLMPGKLPNGDPLPATMLEAAIKAASDYAASVDPIHYTGDEASALKSGLIKLSSNPLGLYSTWIERDRNNLRLLVRGQTGSDSWIRSRPTKSQADEFNEDQSKKLHYHFDSIRKDSVTSLLQFPDDNVVNYRRKKTEAIMGESANQWAINTLQWEATGKEVRAEWLHIIAHRFWPATTDTFRNLIFGTKECNTDMMRAEAAVTQLLVSNKVYAVEIIAKTKYTLKEVTMVDDSQTGGVLPGPQSFPVPWVEDGDEDPLIKPSPRWLTAEMEYEIATVVPNKTEGLIHRAKNIFHPFSRQRPFRYEYELDKVLLQTYLDTLEEPSVADAAAMRKVLLESTRK